MNHCWSSRTWLWFDLGSFPRSEPVVSLWRKAYKGRLLPSRGASVGVETLLRQIFPVHVGQCSSFATKPFVGVESFDTAILASGLNFTLIKILLIE